MQKPLFLKFLWLILGLATYFSSCTGPKTQKVNVQFDVRLSPYSSVTDIEIGENSIFLLTDKHEVLSYDLKGEFEFDTLFASPRTYPNGAVEVYLENSFRSLFYFERSLFFLGANPSDLYRFDLKRKEFSKQMLPMSERGLHQVMSSNKDELIVSFRNPQKGIFQFFKVNFPSLETIFLGEITNFKSKNNFKSYSFQDDLFLISPLEEGLFKLDTSGFTKVTELYFLDSILYKGELKKIFDLGEYASLAPWQRNQYQSDEILSATQISDQETFFLLKLLNRTDPNSPEFEIVLYKKTGDKVSWRNLEGYQFSKLDTETQTFLGFTFESKAVVISNLDSLLIN